ncbi:MAG: nucleotidyl transferase AbiEii/AbiGii toxin family protein [Candidatus Aenigmarchaeota archaeon]|nr:nucleotidyl transferase AbiEii/AbiGii toxin family protein [Candidatus Aenigmarchaeota archaeon]
MILLEELREKARLKSLSMGNAEKDYLIDLILLSISKRTKSELVFKGGTCLYKFYKLDRFSEDIDFTAITTINAEKLAEGIISDLKAFGINCTLHRKKEPFNSVLMTLRCEGPLYSGTPQSYATVRVDINLKSGVDAEPLTLNYSSWYSDIPRFSLIVMQENEIVAEKIRAVFSRNKARDVYDLWFLLNKGVAADENIIGKKLEYYSQKWGLHEFEKSIEAKRSIWKKELGLIMKNVPGFDGAKKLVLKEAKKWTFRKKHQ